MSIGRMRLKSLADSGDETARLIQRLKSDPGRFLGPVLVGNNLVNIAISSIATAMAISLLGEHGIGIAVGVSTVAIVLLGEILPKSLAAANPEAISRRLARAGDIAAKVLYPVSWAFTSVVGVILRLAGSTSRGAVVVTQEELQNVVDAAEESGSLDPDEKEMIQGVFRFGDLSVGEIMVPRPDILGVSSTVKVCDAADLVLKGHYSRIPVFTESVENITGFIHVKDLLKAYLQGSETAVSALVRPILFVPATKKVDELFDQMRLRRVHVAIALDEYGSTAGLVTMEDILEEIVGDIMDEHDPAEEPISPQPDGSVMIDGSVSLDEVREELEVDLHEEGVDTIGGLVFHRMGRVPKVGDTAEDGLVSLRVEEMKGKRVVRVRLRVETRPASPMDGR